MHKLKTDILPFIGKRPITEIDVPKLLDVLRRIEKRGALNIAARARQICGQVFRHAINVTLIDGSLFSIDRALEQKFPSLDVEDLIRNPDWLPFAVENAEGIRKTLCALDKINISDDTTIQLPPKAAA